MCDAFVVMDRKNFEEEVRDYGLKVGETVQAWSGFWGHKRSLDRYLEDGDRLFIFTARPGSSGERLWLVTVLEDVYDDDDCWRAGKEVTIPVVDITPLRKKLTFHTGNGLSQVPGKLGNSLQSPRKLTPKDIAMLEAAIEKGGSKLSPNLREAVEGKQLLSETTRYTRDPLLAQARLEKDGSACLHCGFNLDLIEDKPRGMSRILHAHHIYPLHETKETTTKLSHLMTLCPTCHSVAHALAAAEGKERVDLKLLKKHYPLS